MANEAIKRYDESSGHGGVIQDYTVGNLDAIEKGTLLSLQDLRTVSGTVGMGVALAGIAAREKVAGDGRTRLPVYKKGYFDMQSSGAIAIGEPLIAAGGVNQVKAAGLHSGSQILGYAEEVAVVNVPETILVRLDL